MRTFADFSNQLMALKETLKREEIANVAGDGDRDPDRGHRPVVAGHENGTGPTGLRKKQS